MKQWNWTIGRQLGVTMGAVLMLLCALGGLSLWSSRHQEAAAMGAISRIRSAGEAQLVINFAIEQYQALADNIINRHTNRTEYTEARKGFVEASGKLRDRASTSDETAWSTKAIALGKQLETKYDQELIPLVAQFLAAKNETDQMKIAGDISKLDDSIDALVAEIKELAEKCVASMEKQADAQQAEFNATAKSDFRWILIISGSALLLGCAGGVWVVLRISRQITSLASDLESGARETASASGQVSQASRSLAEGASDQAASLEETSAALEELASMTQRNADAAEQAKNLASQTRVSADAGAKDMVEMQAAMKELEASSGSVSKIVKEIDEIAFQTNILALNAAVEAARAGEAGMGFAVVADEVRNLAQRSAMAAKETALKIEDAVSKSTRGVELSAKVTVNFEEIATKARQVDQVVGEIAMASKEQSQGIQQVNVAITQMDKVTQSNAASAEESASASTELHAQAKAVTSTVGSLLQLVGRTLASDPDTSVTDRFHGQHADSGGSDREQGASTIRPGQPQRKSGTHAGGSKAAAAEEIPMPKVAAGSPDFKDF